MSQRDLAAKIGKNHGTVAKIELGERRVDMIEYFELVRAMGADPAEEAQSLMQQIAALDGQA